MTGRKTSVAEDAAETEEESPVVEATDEIEDTQDADSPGTSDDSRPGRLKRFTGRMKNRSSAKKVRGSGKVGILALAILVVASLSVLGWQLWFYYRPDSQLDADAAKAAITAASEGTIAILSYSPDTLDHDFSTARSHLTGEFLSYYDQFTQQIVAPAAKQKAVKTSAVVLRSALSEFHADSAVVLLFINQSTQSKDRPEPTMTNSSVLVTLTKADGKWLISQFNPA